LNRDFEKSWSPFQGLFITEIEKLPKEKEEKNSSLTDIPRFINILLSKERV